MSGKRKWRSQRYGTVFTTGRRVGGAGATIARVFYTGISGAPVYFWHAWTTRKWSNVFQVQHLDTAKQRVESWLSRHRERHPRTRKGRR